MRIFYFFIFLVVIAGLAAGIFYFSIQFYDTWELAITSRLQADILDIQLKEKDYLRRLKESDGIALVFVGDIMLSRGVAHQIEKYNDVLYPFLRIADVIQRADLAFGNLEGPISSRGKNQGSAYSFRADPQVVEGLVLAGFDVLSLANNHIMDWGADALLDTIEILKANGIQPVGAGENYEKANKPAILKLHNTRIAFLAYTTLYPKSLEATAQLPGVSSFEIGRVKTAIKQLKESNTADVIVISFHWGEEYQTVANATQRKIARALIDAGADLIIGHHPHVAQEVEQYKGKWIAYSLGNFVFDQNFSDETKEGIALFVSMQNGRIFSVTAKEVLISGSFQPSIGDK